MGMEHTRMGCHVGGGTRVHEPVAAAAILIVQRHAMEGGVEAGRNGTGTLLWRRCGQCSHGRRRVNAGTWSEDARAPGVERPGLDNTLLGA